jgi:hypothetical protein
VNAGPLVDPVVRAPGARRWKLGASSASCLLSSVSYFTISVAFIPDW